MDFLPDDCVVKFHPDTLEAVRKSVGLDNPVRMNDAINLLEDWINKQNHFARKDFSRNYLEITLVISKGLVERAKKKIEKLCTFRTLMPEFFENVTVEEFSEIANILYHAHLPVLTKEQYRVYICKVFNTDFDNRLLLRYYRNTILYAEYLRKYEYCSGFRIILDFSECNIMHFLSKINPLNLRQILMVLMEGYGMSIKGIYVITASKMVDGLISLLKQVLSAKVGERITAYKTIDTLTEFIPKDVLPVEYGGTEKPLKEINEQWLKAFGTPEFQKYFEHMNKFKTDESRRQANGFNEEYAGTPGSFRALVVD